MSGKEVVRLLVGMVASGLVVFLVFGFKKCFPDVVGDVKKEQELADERTEKRPVTIAVEITDALTGTPVINCRVNAYNELTTLDRGRSNPSVGLYVVEFLVHRDSLSKTMTCEAPGYHDEYKWVQIPQEKEKEFFPQQIVLSPMPSGKNATK